MDQGSENTAPIREFPGSPAFDAFTAMARVQSLVGYHDPASHTSKKKCT